MNEVVQFAGGPAAHRQEAVVPRAAKGHQPYSLGIRIRRLCRARSLVGKLRSHAIPPGMADGPETVMETTHARKATTQQSRPHSCALARQPVHTVLGEPEPAVRLEAVVKPAIQRLAELIGRAAARQALREVASVPASHPPLATRAGTDEPSTSARLGQSDTSALPESSV